MKTEATTNGTCSDQVYSLGLILIASVTCGAAADFPSRVNNSGLVIFFGVNMWWAIYIYM